MTRMIWMLSAAALAVTAPAAAKDRGEGKGREAASERKAERQQRVERQRPQRVERQQVRKEAREARPAEVRKERRADRVDRSQRVQERRVERPQRVEQRKDRRIQRAERQQVRRAERPERFDREMRKAMQRQQREVRKADNRIDRDIRKGFEHQQREARKADKRIDRDLRKGFERQQREARKADKRIDRAERRILRDDRYFARDDRQAIRWQALGDRRADRIRWDRDVVRDRIRQHRKPSVVQALLVGQQVDRNWYDSYMPLSYRTRYVDTPDYYYRYNDDGYVYRIDRDNDIVSALIPLLGGTMSSGYYGVGQAMPYAYRSGYVPYGYQSLYYDTPDSYYRHAGGAIYQVDPTSQLIMGLAALLTGQNLGIGQMLPASYDVYNVPFQYRDRYYDTQDAWYRYGDGNIYQVDPYSRRISASYPIYGDSYMVGDPWPVAYPDYNVPYGYRDLYGDTQAWDYRYANGAIYQVDPDTRLIQALVALVTGNQFAVGQPMPLGYDIYNVPSAYRDRYYDSPDRWFRYDDGVIYEVNARNGLIEQAIPIYA
ncbi:hypothetical protein [Sphingomonas xanthus]|uniref:Uncharacterized protein n=1 Tax=Sphingomonas xanthus TaxID=2594473 RepID=A0A516IP33_9SPHN|nr:hypothetical protein [Sphingomonas xanthus]QDP18637.1 hypothetical protein FMM02_00855 [Sphingomonas xanthus]